MINMHMIADSEIKELSPSHVQLLNTMFANKKKRLDCFNDIIKGKVKHGSKLLSLQKAIHDEIDVNLNLESAGEEAAIMKTVAWSNLAISTKQLRLASATKEIREKCLPFLRKCINPLDDDGAPLDDNLLMSELLRYGVRYAQKKN